MSQNLDFRDYYVTFKIKLNTILIANKKNEASIYDYLLGAPRMFLLQIIPEGAMVEGSTWRRKTRCR